MNNPELSPIEQLNVDRSSFVSQAPFHQNDFPYQMPKIDHAFIIENYRRLRTNQRDQLAKMRMPDHLKRKIFNFKQDQDLKYEKPELVIFNHPFRGKTVMTKQEVEKQLQRQRKNVQMGENQQQIKGEKVQQNILNNLQLSEEKVTLRKAKMARQSSQSSEENYPQKQRLVSKQPEEKLASEINKKEEKKMQGNIVFMSKEKDKSQTEKEKTAKMQKIIAEKEEKSARKSTHSKSNEKNIKRDKSFKANLNDIPIIGEEPIVVRDIKFEDENMVDRKNSNKKLLGTDQKSRNSKGLYRPFGSQHQIREFQARRNQNQSKARQMTRQGQNERQLDKSMSEISAIASKEMDEELSNSQSLNKALFLE